MDSVVVNMENLSTEEREQLMKLIEKANNVEDKVWKPKKYDEYYIITGYGEIHSDTWHDSNHNELVYSIGNCFRTKEEAEFAVERLKVIAEMKRIAAKDDDVEWDGYLCHYFVFYDERTSTLNIGTNSWCKYTFIYFASEERVQEAIDTIGEDRIKKYLFGIEV